MSRTLNKSLAMRKLEKSLTAVIDKGYSRRPYDVYPLMNFENLDDPYSYSILRDDGLSHIDFVHREMNELDESLYELKSDRWRKYIPYEKIDKLDSVMDEIADISNCLDFMYEHILAEYIYILDNENLEGKIFHASKEE